MCPLTKRLKWFLFIYFGWQLSLQKYQIQLIFLEDPTTDTIRWSLAGVSWRGAPDVLASG